MENTRNNKIGEWVRENINLVILLAMVFLGAVLTKDFFTLNNLMNLLRRVTINGIMAAGFTLTLLVGGFDLSIAGTMSLSAVLAVGIEKSSGSAALGMAVAIAAGAAMGLLNGLLMKLTRGGSGEAFIITLGTQLVATSAAMTYCSGLDIYGVTAPWYQALGQGNIGGFPIAAIVWLAILVILQFIIKKTVFGRQMLMTGANKDSAFLAGVDVGKMKAIVFTMTGVLTAIAAIIMTARTTAAGPKSGTGADFDAAIASIVGGNSIVGGKGGMVQVLIGVFIYGLITNILNLMGVESVYQYIVKGAVLLLVICLDNLKRR